MSGPLAAQQNLDDWVQIVVIILVVAGSVFGPLVKKLIETFTPAKPGEKGEDESDPKERSSPDLSRLPEAFMPPLPEVTAYPARPSRKEEAPQHAGQAIDELSSADVYGETPPTVPGQPPRQATPPAEVRPPVRPVTSKLQKPQKRVPIARAAKRSHMGAKRSVGPPESRPLVEAGELSSSMHDAFDHPEVDSGIASAIATERGCCRTIGRLSTHSLRHAIIMSEVLGPPIALRPPGTGAGSFA